MNVKNKFERKILGVIETWFFGKYFQDMTFIQNLEGCCEYLDTDKEGINLQLSSKEECIEFMKYFNIEREFYDSKYGHMGTYKIDMIKFVSVTDDDFLVKLHAYARFSALDWATVKNTEE